MCKVILVILIKPVSLCRNNMLDVKLFQYKTAHGFNRGKYEASMKQV